MDDSKLETKENREEWVVYLYIFHVMYGKEKSDLMDPSV
jgi:hypothetical protein